MKKKTKIILASALAVLGVSGLAVGGYYVYKSVTAPTEQQKPVEPDTPTPPDDGGEQPLTQTITFESEGQEPVTKTVATGSHIETPTAPTREGYIFQGWALQGTTDIVDFSTLTATENMTFVAIWLEEPALLGFVFENGSVSKYTGTETEVVIPATYSLDANGNAVEGEDYAVTSIGSQAFVGSGITKLTIPSSVTNLATNCFQGMVQNLIVVFNGENPPQMNMTFNHGSLMIYVPKNAVATYQKAWVAYKSKITASSVLKSNTLSFTFEGGILTGLVRNETDIIIPSSYSLDQDGDPIEGNDYAVTGIGAKAFYDNNTITSITIPACITSIGDNAFFSCSNLASIKVEEGNAVYDSRNNCNAIIKTSTNTLIIGCQNTVIPGTITSIEKSAFCGCEGLTSITIPDNVTRIERETFMGCVLLTSITISENVNYIGYEAFGYCFNLESIFLEGTTPPTIDLLIFENSSPTIYVPDEAVDAYKEAWADYADQIKPKSEYVEA